MANQFKDEFAIISFYLKLYEDKYGIKPTINKYKEKWAIQSLIEDFGMESVRDTIMFYFRTGKDGHPFSWLLFNFESVNSSLKAERTDIIMREERRRKTQELAMEYLNGVSG